MSRARATNVQAGRPFPRVIPAALLLIVLAACGTNEAADPQSGEDGVRAEPTPSSASPTEEAQGGASEPDPRALGIDTVQWPGDQKGAQAVFDQMPNQLTGMKVKRGGFFGPSTGVLYGPGDRGIGAWVMGTDKEVPDPKSALAVMFGMGMICTKGTYAGTASQSRWGGGPDIDRKGTFGSEDLWWFSCDFEAGESQTVTGHAIGWVSGDLGWLVFTPDKETTEATVEALTNAADE